jgi:hypothetical protein
LRRCEKEKNNKIFVVDQNTKRDCNVNDLRILNSALRCVKGTCVEQAYKISKCLESSAVYSGL